MPQGNGAGGNRPVGLIDGIYIPVVVVVNRLGETSQQGAAHQHAGQGSGAVLPSPLETTTGGSTTNNAPDQGNPGNRFHQLQPQLPGVLAATGPLHAK